MKEEFYVVLTGLCFFCILPRPSLRYDLGYDIRTFGAENDLKGQNIIAQALLATTWAMTLRTFGAENDLKGQNIIAQAFASLRPGL